MGTRITADLGNPALLRLLKLEASNSHCSVREVLIHALEAYFAEKLETKALMKASESIFTEWADSRDSQYDSL